MKLEVPYKIVGEISTKLTDSIINKVEDKDWYIYDFRKPMGFNDCNSILLRHSPEYVSEKIKNMPLFEKFKKELYDILDYLKKFYQFKDYVAFMARLSPNGKIFPHKDYGEFLTQINRIHIPLKSNEKCFYVVEDTEINMKVGTMYEIDNLRTHSVYNNGDDYRTHLIVNLYPKKINLNL